MNQTQLTEALAGKAIVKINFTDNDQNNIAITSIELEGGELLTLGIETNLSHPERQTEEKEFLTALASFSSSGIISFKAKYLSQSFIEREIANKHREIKSDGYGQINSTRQDYVSYRFD